MFNVYVYSIFNKILRNQIYYMQFNNPINIYIQNNMLIILKAIEYYYLELIRYESYYITIQFFVKR